MAVSEADVDAMRAARARGLSRSEVAAEFGWEKSTVTHHAPTGPFRSLSKQAVRDIRRRQAKGERQVALAHEYGLSQSTISEIVRRVIYKDVA